MAKITLTKVNVIGDKYAHVFKMDDGSTQEVETTQEDYEQLAAPEHVDPTIVGGTWLSSGSRKKLDTVSGDLSDGEYFEDGAATVVKYGGKYVNVEKEDIVDGKIQQEIIDIKKI